MRIYTIKQSITNNIEEEMLGDTPLRQSDAPPVRQSDAPPVRLLRLLRLSDAPLVRPLRMSETHSPHPSRSTSHLTDADSPPPFSAYSSFIILYLSLCLLRFSHYSFILSFHFLFIISVISVYRLKYRPPLAGIPIFSF